MENYEIVKADFNEIAELGDEQKWNHNNLINNNTVSADKHIVTQTMVEHNGSYLNTSQPQVVKWSILSIDSLVTRKQPPRQGSRQAASSRS